jgi:hypothetical protein
MAKSRELPLADYPTGTRTFVRQTPNGLAGFLVEIGRSTSADLTIWPDPASRIKISVECSFDGGQSFPPDGGGAACDIAGGIFMNKLGAEVPLSVFGCRFSPNEPTAVRITVEVVNGPIRTFADVTVL